MKPWVLAGAALLTIVACPALAALCRSATTSADQGAEATDAPPASVRTISAGIAIP